MCTTLPARARSATPATPPCVANGALHRLIGACPEWAAKPPPRRSKLSPSNRKAYISAVLCLMKLPAKTDKGVAPGARSRYDDFLAVHIQQTLSIHGTVSIRSAAVTLVLSHPLPLTGSATGQFLVMAPLLHLGLRAGATERVRLQRHPALLELGQVGLRPAELAVPGRQRH